MALASLCEKTIFQKSLEDLSVFAAVKMGLSRDKKKEMEKYFSQDL